MAWKREFRTERWSDEVLRPVRLTQQDVTDLATIFTDFAATQPESRQHDLRFEVNDHRAEDVADLRKPPGKVESARFSSSIDLRLALYPTQTLLSWDRENPQASAAASKIKKVLADKGLGRTTVIAPVVANLLPILFGAWAAGSIGSWIGYRLLDGYWTVLPILLAQVLFLIAIQPWARRRTAASFRPIWSTGQDPEGFVQRHYNGLMLLFAVLAVVVPVVLWAIPHLSTR